MSERALVRILLQSLWPSGLHPQRLEGRFASDGALDYARAIDLDKEWWKAPTEAPEAFERRIVAGIAAHRGRPMPDLRAGPRRIEEEEEQPAPLRPGPKYGQTPKRSCVAHHKGMRRSATAGA